MFFLYLVASIVLIIAQTVLWRKYLFLPIDVLLYFILRKVEIIRIILILAFVLLGDYLVFSTFAFFATHLSGLSYVIFYILSAIFWFFIYGKSTYNRKRYLENVDVVSDSTYVVSVKRSTTELEFAMLFVELVLIYIALLFIIVIAIWPSIGLWT